jgi:LysR family glycine cleavage system transcriptional activator
MIQRLPPMNWLRTFELVAFHNSFTRAAEDLNISTSAVSQQIKQLEEFLGIELFRRLGNRLCLTDAGQACLPTMHDAFRRIGRAIEQIHNADRKGPLNVSVAPSFAARWLMARLDRFYAAHSDIDLAVFVSMNLASFDGDDIDIAIRYGSGLYPGLYTHHLSGERVMPVASPALLRRHGRLSRPQDLSAVPLIHDRSLEYDRTCPDWKSFLTSFGVDNVDWQKGPQFNQSALVTDAVIRGWGVALVKGRLAGDDLRDGRLVQLFDYSVDVGFGYYAVCVPEKAKSQKVSAFIEWLGRELAEDAIEDMPPSSSGRVVATE